MKKRAVVQQDAGDRESWKRRAVKGLATMLVGKLCQDSNLMMMIPIKLYCRDLLDI